MNLRDLLKQIGYSFISIALYAGLAAFLVYIVSANGLYPSGDEAFTYLYKGSKLYSSIMEGNFFPLYDPVWYNGVDMMRFWEPLPLYWLSACFWYVDGAPLGAYLAFVGSTCFVSSCVIYYLCCRMNRPVFGIALGAIWFFLPNNIYTIFSQGVLEHGVTMVVLPFALFYLIRFVKQGMNFGDILGIVFSVMILCLTNFSYGILFSVVAVVYILCYAIPHYSLRSIAYGIAAIICGFGLSAFWTIPNLVGNNAIADSSEEMASFFQSILITLNPLRRLAEGNAHYYVGLSVVLIAIFGLMVAYRESRLEFIFGLLMIAVTSTLVYPALLMFFDYEAFFMLRYLSLGVLFIFFGLVEWKQCRPLVLGIFIAIMLVDFAPSLLGVWGYHNNEPAEERLERILEDTLISQAKTVTKQRLAILDDSTLGATGIYLATAYEYITPSSYGYGWKNIATSENIAQLNRSFDNGNFIYMFDRTLELGNDTVLVRTSLLYDPKTQIPELDNAATLNGYILHSFNEEYRLYHYPITESFGTVTEYDAIAIGSVAQDIALDFADTQESQDYNLNHYTFEQLSGYDTIYLGGFTYEDREAAEDLVLSLSRSGVRIILLADGIPDDPTTQSQSFLGIYCNPIVFSNGFPELRTELGILNTKLFPDGHAQFSTVYVNGLTSVYGTVLEDYDLELDFCGTYDNENLIVIGINLTYYYSLTHDEAVGELLEFLIGTDRDALPDRKLVPVNITYGASEIIIETEEDNVNTTLAVNDGFQVITNKRDTVTTDNHLFFVNAGKTDIQIATPYLFDGVVVILGALALLLMVYASYWIWKHPEWEAKYGKPRKG
ncbi:MAG: hypothetical protein K6C69_03900 [Lachnospiraceae bacterium]|nr:hypothetical protein [Lachnospiraceae bacterium]